MVEVRNDDGTTTRVDDRSTYVPERRGNGGKVIGGLVLAALIIVGILFATGFWSANVNGGSLPKVDVSAKGGDLPSVDLNSKEIVVGTTKTKVDVPTIKTEKTTIDVPTVGVKDDKK